MVDQNKSTIFDKLPDKLKKFFTPRNQYVALLFILVILLSILGISVSPKIKLSVFKLSIGMITPIILIIAWFADRKKSLWYISLLITAVIAFMAITVTYRENRFWLKDSKLKRIHAWNAYHYVYGAKYFDELGYFDLYYASLLADRDGDNFFKNVKKTRSMHDYKIVPVAKALEEAEREGIRQRFSDERWEEFKRDLRTMHPYMADYKWAKCLRDLGFHPSPAFLILHKPLLNSLPIHKRKVLEKLCSVQNYLFVLTFLVACWAFGLRTTLVMVIWMNVYYGNFHRLAGGYFSYDWFSLAVVAAALYKKGHNLLPTPLLAYSAMMRGFPGLLATHAGLQWTVSLFKRKWPDKKRNLFVGGMVFFCLAIVLLGSTTKYGPGAWLEWKEKMHTHSNFQPLNNAKVGIKFLFAMDFSKMSYKMGKKRLKENLEKNKVAFRTTQAFFVLLTLAAMLRRKNYNGMLMGLIIAYSTMVLSRYYISTWVLMFTWTALDKRKIGNLLSSIWLFFLADLFLYMMMTPAFHRRTPYYYLNLGLLAYFIAIVVNFLIRDYLALRKSKLEPITQEI
jgi:hypothetical protein